jgi:heme/copper-type cytochrome/quinol oxidase subunit 2
VIAAVYQWRLAQGLIDARAEYDDLFAIGVPVAIGVFTLIVLVAFAAVLIRRRRPPELAPGPWRERNPLQGSYAVLLVCVAALVLFLTFTSQHKVDTLADQPHPSVVIKVLGSHADSQRDTSSTSRDAQLSRRRSVESGPRRAP